MRLNDGDRNFFFYRTNEGNRVHGRADKQNGIESVYSRIN